MDTDVINRIYDHLEGTRKEVYDRLEQIHKETLATRETVVAINTRCPPHCEMTETHARVLFGVNGTVPGIIQRIAQAETTLQNLTTGEQKRLGAVWGIVSPIIAAIGTALIMKVLG